VLWGTNMVSSFADSTQVVAGLRGCDLVAVHDLFMSDTARECADVLLPATSWLEEVGMKATNTHLYLMPQALEPPGEARSASWVLRHLARRRAPGAFFPSVSSPALFAPPPRSPPRPSRRRRPRTPSPAGIPPQTVSPVPYPTLAFDTPSGKVEFVSERAKRHGLPALTIYEPLPSSSYPLAFRQGRTLAHFHGFYDHGRALPSLATADAEPLLWISPAHPPPPPLTA